MRLRDLAAQLNAFSVQSALKSSLDPRRRSDVRARDHEPQGLADVRRMCIDLNVVRDAPDELQLLNVALAEFLH